MSHNFKKKFGQNFLKDKNILKKIVSLSPITKDDLVIEIGTGEGDLTSVLSDKAKYVFTYEIDEELKNTLENKFVNTNVIINFKDFLTTNLKNDINKYVYNNIYVVANIPYYITTSIIMKFVDEDVDIKSMVLLMQKEVGEKFVDTKNSATKIIYEYFFDIKKKFIIKKELFYPIPKVDSVILKFNSKNYKKIDKEKFKNFIYDCFKYKRKTLKNNLKNYDLETIESLLVKINKNLSNRAEDLSTEDFTFLYFNLFKQ